MRATPPSDGGMWACGVRWVVAKDGLVLLVAVRTAVKFRLTGQLVRPALLDLPRTAGRWL
ncbi:MAG: hypothetical protein ACRDRL_05915 [Sciscionella sp.]